MFYESLTCSIHLSLSLVYWIQVNLIDNKLCENLARKGSFINYVRMILAVFYPLHPQVRVRKIFQTPPSYSNVKFHLVFQHNKMLLEKDQLH